MAEFLITLAQLLCICGLLYGAYLSITYSDAEPPKKPERHDPVTTRQPTLLAEHHQRIERDHAAALRQDHQRVHVELDEPILKLHGEMRDAR